jgi:hypothetical protein
VRWHAEQNACPQVHNRVRCMRQRQTGEDRGGGGREETCSQTCTDKVREGSPVANVEMEARTDA